MPISQEAGTSDGSGRVRQVKNPEDDALKIVCLPPSGLNRNVTRSKRERGEHDQYMHPLTAGDVILANNYNSSFAFGSIGLYNSHEKSFVFVILYSPL